MTLVAGSRVIRAGMVVQLATVKQERNVTILKVIEKDGVLKLFGAAPEYVLNFSVVFLFLFFLSSPP
jgi:hypothetical protein